MPTDQSDNDAAPKVKLEETELDTKDHLAAIQMEIDSGSGTDVPEIKPEKLHVKVEKEELDSSEDPQNQAESSAGTDGEPELLHIKIKEEQSDSDYFQKPIQSAAVPLADVDKALKIKSKSKGSDSKDHGTAKKSGKDSGKGAKKKRHKGSQGIKMPNKLIIDTERLIIEIRKRPSLFNPSDTDFADKQKRREAWEEICVEIIKDWAGSSSKIQVKYLNEIRKRWVTLRDYFQKELEAPTKKNRNGSRSSRKSAFIYFSDLQFLKPIMEDSETSLQVDEEMYDEPIDETPAANSPAPTAEDGNAEPARGPAPLNPQSPETENSDGEYVGDAASLHPLSPASEESVRERVRDRPARYHLSPERGDVAPRPRVSEPQPFAAGKLSKKRKHIHEEEEEVPELPKPIAYFRDTSVDDERDEDRLFLLSLLKTLKRFSASQKLEIKLKMRQTVARAAKEGSPQRAHPLYPHPYAQYSHSYTQQHYMQPQSQSSSPSDAPRRMRSPYSHNYSGPSYENAPRQSPPFQSSAAYR
ncbi:uncharacterized protein LOC100492197 isoform X1 [Xenopus tropicalis]|uniref:Uncharacterized protein LOC100492197 isoform X1 n=2 Tax=Xenopus tropicalis TaxID=8364 RepID=A0A8J0QY42_XENTR|nr:uncharacterized protein LOC100492197 isoform X1 [Xenopus tropicalis]|eukprot:XP_002942381.1 PREDICTED: uncharacterized protein LOC100492197 isoform X1 [Xenopus tropicalis]